jgi:hypothetical protein
LLMQSQKLKLSQLRKVFHTTDPLLPMAIKTFAPADPIKIQEHDPDPHLHAEMASVITSTQTHTEMSDVVTVHQVESTVSGHSLLARGLGTLVHFLLVVEVVVDMVSGIDHQEGGEMRM